MNENMAAYRTLCTSGLLELLNVFSRELIMIPVLVRMPVRGLLHSPNDSGLKKIEDCFSFM